MSSTVMPASGRPRGPAWASALGVVAIVLGVFLTAFHGTEWLKQSVMVNAMPADGVMPEAVCPEGELEEEGLTRAECEYMVAHVRGIALSTPEWFPGVQQWLAGVGVVLAFVSIIVGGALVNGTPASPIAAVVVFGGLLGVDVLQFAAAVNAGPILRDIYLWQIVLWLILHLMMATAAVAGRQGEAPA